MIRRLLFGGLFVVSGCLWAGCSDAPAEPETEAEIEEDITGQESMMDAEMNQPTGEAVTVE